MILALQQYSFQGEYRKGSTLHIADTLSRAPLPTTSHKQVHDELVYQAEFDSTTPDLCGFQGVTFRDIRAAASSDPEQIALHSLDLKGWPNEKSAIPELARPHWSIRHELTAHDGLLFKQDESSYPPCSERASCANFMLPIGALNLPSATLTIVYSGLPLIVK